MLPALLLFASLSLAGGTANDPMSNGVSPCVGKESLHGVYIFTPGCSGFGRRGGNSVEMRYNKLGLRDKDYAPTPPRGTTRVLVMGPSLFTGPGVEEPKTILRRVEALLRTEKRKVEIINGSTEGYFTVQTALRLRDFLAAYSPQLVIYKLSGAHAMFNDLMAYGHLHFGADGAPENLGSLVPFYDPDFPAVVRNFIMSDPTQWRFNLAFTAFRQRERFQLTREIYPSGATEEEARLKLLAPEVALLKYMQSAVEKAHGKFLVLWDPTERLTNHYNDPRPGDFELASFLQRFVREINFSGEPVGPILRANGLTVVESTLLSNPSPSYFLIGDYHLSAEGSEAAARSLLSVVRSALPNVVWRP